MKITSVGEIYTATYLVGFGQVVSGGHNYLGILEKDTDKARCTLTVFLLIDGRWKIVKTILTKYMRIQAIDVAMIGTDLVFGLELNERPALTIGRVALSVFLDPTNKNVSLKEDADVDLTDLQSQKVQLPTGQMWNTIRMSPDRWLFSPQLVRGESTPQLIANTADGQAMLFSPTAHSDHVEFSIPNAAEPQAHIVSGQRVVAFKHYAEPYYPFWSLPRYSGSSLPKSGDLMVATNPTSLRNLSREMSLGPIVAYKMVSAPNGQLWIFALSDAPVGTDVIALSQKGAGWTIAGRWSVDGEIDQISAEYGTDAWHLIYDIPTKRGRSLQYQIWQVK